MREHCRVTQEIVDIIRLQECCNLMNTAIILHHLSNDVNTFYAKKVVNCVKPLNTARLQDSARAKKAAEDSIFCDENYAKRT